MIESFITKTKKSGNSLIITIPYTFVRFCGLKDNENIKVYIKKIKGDVKND